MLKRVSDAVSERENPWTIRIQPTACRFNFFAWQIRAFELQWTKNLADASYMSAYKYNYITFTKGLSLLARTDL